MSAQCLDVVTRRQRPLHYANLRMTLDQSNHRAQLCIALLSKCGMTPPRRIRCTSVAVSTRNP